MKMDILENPMPRTIPLDEAQAHLKELIQGLSPGETLIITLNEKPIATLKGESSEPGLRPPPGLGKGWITILEDDEEHLEDFAEYMP